MNKATWNSLSFFEQLSNIDGDVERLIRAHEKYTNGITDTDNGYYYLDQIRKMIKLTFFDPKNISKAYRSMELNDEADELLKFLNRECTADYIRNYWNQYTKAVSV